MASSSHGGKRDGGVKRCWHQVTLGKLGRATADIQRRHPARIGVSFGELEGQTPSQNMSAATPLLGTCVIPAALQ